MQPPYVYNMIISIFFFIIFTGLNAVTTAADFELSPVAGGMLAACHSRVEVWNGVGVPTGPPCLLKFASSWAKCFSVCLACSRCLT